MSLAGSSFVTQTASNLSNAVPSRFRTNQLYACDIVIAFTLGWILLRYFRAPHRQLRTTELRGPPSESFIFGSGMRTLDSKDSGAEYEAWAKEYGLVYSLPSTLGRRRIVLCDPKAISHYYSKESWTYIQTNFSKTALLVFFGRGLSWAHGEVHKRQRKALLPAFGIAAIRPLTPIFYDTAYKLKGAWDALIENNENGAVIEVQNWMNHVSLDNIGLAGFSHNFGALEGKCLPVTEIFDTFSSSPAFSVLDKAVLLLGLVFPWVALLPTHHTSRIWKLNGEMHKISTSLLDRIQKEMEMGSISGKEEKSVLGLLIKGKNADGESRLRLEEVTSVMKQAFLAGFETTSISLTWALIELARNPDMQTRLRDELLGHGADPTFDQFTNGLPYLNAVVNEILRVHPPVLEFTRIANQDDVIPLSEPIRTKSGEFVDSINIAKGTLVAVSMKSINRSALLWGEDAKVFRPDRWLEDANGQDGIPAKAKGIRGYRHMLTFVDGPRMCLGKHFAVAEFKAVLVVLIKNYVFELRDGVDTEFEIQQGVLPRPKVVGEVGCKVPLRVRPYVG